MDDRRCSPQDVPAEVDDPVWSLLAKEEGALGVEDDAAPLVDPEVLFDECAVFLGQKAVCEADKAVRGSHIDGVGRKVGTGRRRRRESYMALLGPHSELQALAPTVDGRLGVAALSSALHGQEAREHMATD